MKRVLLVTIIAILLVLFTLYRIDGFFLYKIQGPLISGKVEKPSLDLILSLSQPYHYLAKGRQCFVFESNDGQTVIKFLNYRRFSLPVFLRDIPLPHYWKMWILGLDEKRRLRFESTMESFQLVEKHFLDETAIMYIHLKEGGNLPILQITDRGHRTHQIDLNHTAFIVQKKAHPIFAELQNRWQSGQQVAFQEGLQEFVDLIHKRCSYQLADDDRDVGINFGFCEGRLILLDPGRLYHDPDLKEPQRLEEEMQIASKRLRIWLSQNHPEFVAFLDQQIQSHLSKTEFTTEIETKE